MGTKSKNKNYTNLGTKITKLQEQKFKNIRKIKVTKIWEQKLQKSRKQN
jgi:DNA topoisomerase IA